LKTYHDIATDGGSKVAEQVSEQEARLRARLTRIERVVAVMSGKGGVGKSSLTVNLAAALVRSGLRVGIVDADINGASAVQMTGVERHPERTADGVAPALTGDGVEVMSIDLFLEEGTPVEWRAITDHSAFTWRGMVEVAAVREMLADTDWSRLDVLLVDLPPGTDKLPNLLDLVPGLSGAVVVTVPSRASTYIVRKSIQLAGARLKNAPIGLVENMSEFECERCGHVHRLFPDDTEDGTAGARDGADDSMDEMVRAFGLTRLGRIPFDPAFGAETDNGRSYLGAYPERAAARALQEAAARLCEMIRMPVKNELKPVFGS